MPPRSHIKTAGWLLVARARAKLTAKREGGARVSLFDFREPVTEERVLELDEALQQLVLQMFMMVGRSVSRETKPGTDPPQTVRPR